MSVSGLDFCLLGVCSAASSFFLLAWRFSLFVEQDLFRVFVGFKVVLGSGAYVVFSVPQKV